MDYEMPNTHKGTKYRHRWCLTTRRHQTKAPLVPYRRRHQIKAPLVPLFGALSHPMPLLCRGHNAHIFTWRSTNTHCLWIYSACVTASALAVTMGLGCGCCGLGLVGTCWVVGGLWVQSRTPRRAPEAVPC